MDGIAETEALALSSLVGARVAAGTKTAEHGFSFGFGFEFEFGAGRSCVVEGDDVANVGAKAGTRVTAAAIALVGSEGTGVSAGTGTGAGAGANADAGNAGKDNGSIVAKGKGGKK